MYLVFGMVGIAPVEQVGPENLARSAVTAMELYYGALNKLELQRITP